MPRHSGPTLVVSLPGDGEGGVRRRVWEPLRADVAAQLSRMAPLTRDQPDAVWLVEPKAEPTPVEGEEDAA
ncbi:MAG TPA: hypothetical protein VGW74_06915 [Propionibacteriaceae bacterium]|nr:hypothetical protein [Propionibacteriaceae bacterium]